MKCSVWIFILLVVMGCADSSSEQNPVSGSQSCPFSFRHHGLCADIDWKVGPSAAETSSFLVKFWDASKADKAPVPVEGEVSAFIRMTCCGSINTGNVKELAPGEYEVTNLRFMPGEWDVFVQVKRGDEVEKSARRLQVD